MLHLHPFVHVPSRVTDLFQLDAVVTPDCVENMRLDKVREGKECSFAFGKLNDELEESGSVRLERIGSPSNP
jgi:hypothetical protein